MIAFAGDALICVFPEADDVAWDTSTPSSEQLNVDACLRALQCACLLKDHHTDVLSTHIAVSYGPMKLALLGGINNQRIHVMNGGCVSDLSACIDAAGPRQVAVTNRCHERALKAFASTNYCGEEPPIRTRKSNKDGTVIIEYVSQPSAKLDRLQTVSPGGLVRKSGIGSRSINLEMENVSGVIQNFVARPVVNAIATQSLSSISELRVVTTMFLSLDTYSPHIHQDPTTLQPFFLLAQEALIVTGGFLRQFLVDDKGCVLIAMWGIPSFAYANNCSRALNCAVRIFLGCLELDHKCSIGLTTGDVFCGCVGSVERRDFAGIGNDVNMAARLMAKAHGRIIVDNNTYFNLSQQSRDLLKSAEPMKLKGAELPVTPYQYASNVLPEISITDELPGKGTLLRRKTREFLVKQLDRLSASIRRLGSKDMEEDEKVNVETTSFIIITGKPGTGKSLAAKYVKHGAMKRNLPCIAISARQSHIGVPYGLMRELFTELVGLANFDTVLRQNETINKLVDQAYADTKESNKELARQSLYFMLGVRRKYANGKEYLQNERYDNLQSEGEPGSITRLASSSREKKLENELTFYKILCRLLENKPTVLIIENAHFSDELSWNTLSLILKESDINILIFTTVRSYKTTIEDEHNISEASLNENKEKKKINKHLTLLKNVQMAVSGFTQALHFKGAKNEEEDGLQISNSSRTDTHKSMNSNNKRNMNSNVYNSVDEKELYPGESGFESTSLSTKKPTKSLKAIAKRVLKSKLSADNIHTLNEKNVEKIPYASNSKSESTDIIAEAISAKAIKERELKRCISTKISIETDEDLKREVLVDGEYVLEDNSSTTATPKKSPSIDLHMREMIFKQNRNISDWISFETLEAYSNIINDHRTTFIEMTGLRSSEVKEILLNVLGIGAVSKDLISLVLDVSSGNAFWCKEIASFIRERGIDEFEQTIQDDDKNRGNMLKNFILSRMEKLATDHQRIVKLAALIGEFTFDLLQRVLPLRLQEMLNDALELLQNRGFILLIDVYPEKLYGFQNQLIETTLAELTPPRFAIS